MTTFHPRQSGDARRTRKNVNTGTFNFTSQIPPSICAVMFTEHDKSDATFFKSLCKRTVVGYRLYRVQALPLVKTRFLRLAKSSPKTARSPARRARDGRETSGKKSGEISRVISAQRPGNGRTVATAMPLNSGKTTRNLAAQQPRRSSRSDQCNVSRAARRISRRQF